MIRVSLSSDRWQYAADRAPRRWQIVRLSRRGVAALAGCAAESAAVRRLAAASRASDICRRLRPRDRRAATRHSPSASSAGVRTAPSVADVEDPGRRRHDLRRTPSCVVTQPTQGRVQGVQRVCTHQGCVSELEVSDGNINCDCHGSASRSRTARSSAGPAAAAARRAS